VRKEFEFYTQLRAIKHIARKSRISKSIMSPPIAVLQNKNMQAYGK